MILIASVFTIVSLLLPVSGQIGDNYDLGQGRRLCSDWIRLGSSKKCIKVIDSTLEMTRSFESAEKVCWEYSNGSLLKIETAEEESFLTKYLFTNRSISNDIWIGLTLSNHTKSSFKWSDGTSPTYTNWAVGYPKNVTNSNCVQMSSLEPKGVWMNGLCSRKNAVVCQRKPTWTIEGVVGLVEEIDKKLKQTVSRLNETSSLLNEKSRLLQETRQELNKTTSNLKQATTELQILKSNPVPVGFIYVQLGQQPKPAEIWPNVQWQDVSSQYANDFFRVVGNLAPAFGHRQGECSPRVLTVRTHNRGSKAMADVQDINHRNVDISGGETHWTGSLGSGGGSCCNRDLLFDAMNCEVRPRNQAVLVWKRVK